MVAPRILSNTAPEQREYFTGSMFAINGSPAQLKNFIADGLVRGEVELLLTVVAQLLSGHGTGLHAISADDLAAGAVFDDQVFAE